MAVLKSLVTCFVVMPTWAQARCKVPTDLQGYASAQCESSSKGYKKEVLAYSKISLGDPQIGYNQCMDLCECTNGCAGIAYHTDDHWCKGFNAEWECTQKATPHADGNCMPTYNRTAGPSSTDLSVGKCLMSRRTPDADGYALLGTVSCSSIKSLIKVGDKDKGYTKDNADAAACKTECEARPGCGMTMFYGNESSYPGRCYFLGGMCSKPGERPYGRETWMRMAGPVPKGPSPSPTPSLPEDSSPSPSPSEDPSPSPSPSGGPSPSGDANASGSMRTVSGGLLVLAGVLALACSGM